MATKRTHRPRASSDEIPTPKVRLLGNQEPAGQLVDWYDRRQDDPTVKVTRLRREARLPLPEPTSDEVARGHWWDGPWMAVFLLVLLAVACVAILHWSAK